MCWERYIRGGIFGEVYSAFESWQVPPHSNLYAKLPITASLSDNYVLTFSLCSVRCLRCLRCLHCLPCLPYLRGLQPYI